MVSQQKLRIIDIKPAGSKMPCYKYIYVISTLRNTSKMLYMIELCVTKNPIYIHISKKGSIHLKRYLLIKVIEKVINNKFCCLKICISFVFVIILPYNKV